jgi:hypothetical protein
MDRKRGVTREIQTSEAVAVVGGCPQGTAWGPVDSRTSRVSLSHYYLHVTYPRVCGRKTLESRIELQRLKNQYLGSFHRIRKKRPNSTH